MNEDTKPAKAGWTRGTGLRSSLFALYILASAIGFFYVDAYYGYEEFGIDILSHIESIDLLFISIEHIDKLSIVALGGVLAVVLILVIMMSLGILLVAIVGISILILALIFIGSVTRDRVQWLSLATSDVLADRARRRREAKEAKRAERDSGETSVGKSEDDQPLRLVAAYRNAASKSKSRYEPDDLQPDDEQQRRRGASDYFLDSVFDKDNTLRQEQKKPGFIGLFWAAIRLLFGYSQVFVMGSSVQKERKVGHRTMEGGSTVCLVRCLSYYPHEGRRYCRCQDHI